MGISSIMRDWPNIRLSKEEARLLTKVERNPVYDDVQITYSGRVPDDEDADGPLTFGDICYWLDYEANYQNYEEDDRRFSDQAIRAINRFIREHSTYPIRPFGYNRGDWNGKEA